MKYFIPKYLENSMKKEKMSINIVQEQLKQEVFKSFSLEGKVFKKLKKLNLSENRLTDVNPIL